MPLSTRVGNFRNAFISVNGVDLSADLESLTLTWERDNLEHTSMGDDTRISGPGLLNWNVSATFFQDFASGAVWQTLNTPFKNGSDVTLVIRPDKDAAVSTSNPNFSGTAWISSLPPLDGTVGDVLKITVQFQARSKLNELTT